MGQVNWIWTSENYERICLNNFFFLNLALGQVGDKNYGKDCVVN